MNEFFTYQANPVLVEMFSSDGTKIQVDMAKVTWFQPKAYKVGDGEHVGCRLHMDNGSQLTVAHSFEQISGLYENRMVLDLEGLGSEG